MNRVEFQQAGGFPLETDTLNFLQTGLAVLQALCALGGDNFIVSGCVTNGANTSDGFVVINSELLPFKGGLNQARVVIRETVTSRNFENGSSKGVFVDRYAMFGTGAGSVLFSDLVRVKDLKTFRNLPHEASSAINSASEDTLATSKAVKDVYDALKDQMPVGAIIIWSGAINAIPNGWALCDGNDGRPNLKNAFVIGAGDQYSVGSVGGEAQHQLTTNELAKFNINITIPTRRNYGSQSSGGTNALAREEKGGGDQNKTYGSGDVGGDQPHNNLPPYFALAYIIKL